MDINQKIGIRIKEARAKKNYSSEIVARILNLSKGAYSNIENGKVELTFKRIEEIAKALEVDVNQLLPFSNNSNTQISNGSGSNINNCSDFKIEINPEIIDIIKANIESLQNSLKLLTATK